MQKGSDSRTLNCTLFLRASPQQTGQNCKKKSIYSCMGLKVKNLIIESALKNQLKRIQKIKQAKANMANSDFYNIMNSE